MPVELFQAALKASWQGSLVILLILALRPFLGIRVPAWWRCILWAFVLIRLLVPAFVLPPSPASLQNIALVDRPGEQMAIVFDAAYGDAPDLAGTPETGGGPTASENPVPAPDGKWRWQNVFWWHAGALLWAAGFFLLAARILGAGLRLQRRIRREARPAPADLAGLWDQCCQRFSLSRPPSLRAAPWIASPALIGILRPVVLIPEKGSATFSHREWEHVFLHELAHYVRRDHWTHAIQVFALCVHWFNPLIWFGFRFLRVDRELAADECAMNHLHPEDAVGYGDTLLKVLSTNAARPFQPATIGIAEDLSQLKLRFFRIAAFGESRTIGSVAGFLLILAVATVVLGRESSPMPQIAPGHTLGTAKTSQEISVPAERGRIVDRHGKVLADNRLSFDLAIPLPQKAQSDFDLLAFVRGQIAMAEKGIPGLSITITDESLLRHFRESPTLPQVLARDLNPEQRQAFLKLAGHEMTLRAVPLREYPHGPVAAHVLGYVGRAFEPSEPAAAVVRADNFTTGRHGLEKTFDEVLTGRPGLEIRGFDEHGKRAAEVKQAPVPGGTVVTTLDLDLQKLCEQALQQNAQRGAVVVTDCRTGEILALASWPTFDPNHFIPAVSADDWEALRANPDDPLLARAYQAAYLPGSAFKILTGIAAIESGAVGIDEKIPNPPSLLIAGKTFRDWKDVDQGKLTFAEALERRANTWFFQAALKTGAQPILDWALKLGFSEKTGIPLPGEASGVLPTDAVMAENFHQKWGENSDGWLANLAIGQGVPRVTPLQMAQAMAGLGNGGVLHPLRLVTGVKDSQGRLTGEYQAPVPRDLKIRPDLAAEVKKGMVASLAQGQSTPFAATRGWVQWFQGANERRTASWLAGFVPAVQPRYAVAVLVESEDLGEQKSSTTQIAATILRALVPAD